MGFRNPLTSAVAVDTRTGAAPAGVRTYETTDPDRGYPIGVVEWNDGVAGDSPAQALQQINPNPHGQLQAFGALRLKGGSYAAAGSTLTAPQLTLEVGQDPVSGQAAAQARINGGPLILDRPAVVQGAGGQWATLPYIAGAYTGWDAAANAPQYSRTAAGELQTAGIVKILAGFSVAAGATATVANMPAGFYRVGATSWGLCAVLNAAGVLTAVTQLWITGSGVLQVYNNTAAAWGTGFGIVLGFPFPTT